MLADILLNVFLAIAVDNLADAQSLTILEQEQIELKTQRKQMRELKRREREDRHRRERAAGIRKESSSSSSDEDATDEAGGQGGPAIPSATPRPSGMMGMGMMPPPMPCFPPGLADMPPPMPFIPPELLDGGFGGGGASSPFPPGFLPPPMPPPMPVIPLGAGAEPSPSASANRSPSARPTPLSPLSPGFLADGCGGSSEQSKAASPCNAATSPLPNPTPNPNPTHSNPASNPPPAGAPAPQAPAPAAAPAGTAPPGGPAASPGGAGGVFNFGLVTEPQLPPPTETEHEIDAELASELTSKHMMRPRRMTELNFHEKIRPIPNASAFFIFSPKNPYASTSEFAMQCSAYEIRVGYYVFGANSHDVSNVEHIDLNYCI